MIDYKKLNNYLLGMLMKNKKVYYGEHNDKIMLSDSYAVWILEKEHVFINLQLCTFIPEFYKKFIPDNSNYKYSYLTDTIQIDKKMNLRELINEDHNISVLFNEKYHKLFKQCDYEIKDDTSPIMCYINLEIVGIILPVKSF